MTAQRFKATLLSEGPGNAWTFMKLPIDAADAFGSRARISVKGTLNGFAFRTSIYPDGNGGHQMMVNKSMQAGAKANPGENVVVVMERDTSAHRVAVPSDLRRALMRHKAARAGFDKLAPGYRRDYVAWLDEAKKPETRARRIEKALLLLAEGKRLR